KSKRSAGPDQSRRRQLYRRLFLRGSLPGAVAIHQWSGSGRRRSRSWLGSNAEYAAVPAERLVNIPAELDFDQAAAAMLQGMTAHYLSHSTYPIKSGETALIHAAAGGVGALLVQMAKNLGARVIGTAGNEEKARLALAAGAD